MAVRNYDPKNVSVIVGGTSIKGFTDGTFIMAERSEQMWNMKVGVDGIATRAKSNNRSGKVTITLHQSSASNDFLSGLAIADELAPGGTGGVPLLIRDNNGTTLATAATAWVNKLANSEFGKEVANRVWVLETDTLVMNVGSE